MDAAKSPPSSTPKPSRIRTKLPKAKVQQMAANGLSTYQIAKVVDCNQSTIHRFLKRIQPESQAVAEFRSGRAEVLATLQAKNLTIQEKLLEKLEDEGLLASLTPSQISGLMFALNTQHGTLYDKERLETGQSTQNHSVVTKLISDRVANIHKPLKSKRVAGIAPQSGAVGSETVKEAEALGDPAESEAGGPWGTGG